MLVKTEDITKCVSLVAEVVDPDGEWSNLNSIGLVDYLREEKDGTTSKERRYYISSLTNNAELLAKGAKRCEERSNPEDIGEQKINYIGYSMFNSMKMIHESGKIMPSVNLAIIRQIALNLLKQEKTAKNGVKNKRKRAGWDNDYLLKVLLS